MRLLKFVARKSLLALGYPRLETSHPELGVYEVGAIRARMAPELPACQFFYPVNSNSETSKKKRSKSNNQKIPYYRKEAVDGLIDFLGGFGDGIMQMLQEKSHPLQRNYGMDPILEAKSTSQFPLVVFSHGLSGTMEMYTQLCSQIASTGCIVVAVEHEDGSASYAQSLTESDTGKQEVVDIPYKRPSRKIAYTRENVLGFRFPMLEQRVEEVQRIIKHFEREKKANTTPENSEDILLQKIVSVADPSRLHLVGHSFGGATQLLAAQTWETKRQQKESAAAAMVNSTSNLESGTATAMATIAAPQQSAGVDIRTLPIPRSITVFDAWNYPLPDSVLNTGLGASSSSSSQNTPVTTPPIEILSVLSESWATTSPEREQTLQFLRNCDSTTTRVRSCYARDSVHQSVSDTEAYVPTVASQKIGNRGKGEPRHRTIRAIVEEIAGFAETKKAANEKSEIDQDRVLVPFPLQ